MTKSGFLFLLLMTLLTATPVGAAVVQENLGRLNQGRIDDLLAEDDLTAGARVARLSEYFVDVPYQAHSLIGSQVEAEVLVLNFAGVDCFTLLDYLEALRRSWSYAELQENLRQVRYPGGEVAYRRRNHFFSLWQAQNRSRIVDVTVEIGGEKARQVSKQLNRKKDGSLWLPGIPVVEKQLTYLPTAILDEVLLRKLHPGDYVGIFTDRPGLDVSHNGLIIRRQGRVFLRHASSRKVNRRVVDEELLPYLQGKPGLVIYRPR